jgi:hypothetical protein
MSTITQKNSVTAKTASAALFNKNAAPIAGAKNKAVGRSVVCKENAVMNQLSAVATIIKPVQVVATIKPAPHQTRLLTSLCRKHDESSAVEREAEEVAAACPIPETRTNCLSNSKFQFLSNGESGTK